MKNLKKIFMYLMLIFIFSFTFSSEDSKIYLNEKRREPAKLTIGVTKLKTKELPMDFNIEQKIIYTELPQEIDENNLIFVSETLDEIPSLSTTNGRRSVNNIKKYLTKDIKVAPKFTYQLVDGDGENGIEEGKRYLVIKCKSALSGVYVYVIEKGSYHVKSVYKGRFEEKISTLEMVTEQGTVIFNENVRYIKEILGTYDMVSGGVKFTRIDGVIIDNPAFVKTETPNKFIDSNKKADRVKLTTSRGNTGKNKYSNSNLGLFSLEYDIQNGRIRIYTEENKEKVNFELKNWNGQSINETIIIEHIDEGFLGIGDDLIATQEIILSIPAIAEETTTIKISNPIVEFENDDSYLGIVKLGYTDGVKTFEANKSEHIINNPWIDATNLTDYDGSILGKHRVRITSGSNIYEGTTGSNGSTLTSLLGMGTNNRALWKYFGGSDKTIAFGIDEYDFKGGSYTVKIEHLSEDKVETYKIYNYKIDLQEFDGTLYLDKNLDIGKTTKFEKEYEIYSAPNGKLLLGNVGLRELDRRITYNQNGGDGVSVRLLSQEVILKKENSEYTIKGTLTIEEDDSVNNEIRGISREDREARKGNIYLTFARNEEEKLVGGGKYHILTVDSKEPLQVGVKANTGEFLKPVTELWLVTSQKYYKTNIKFKNDEMPLINEKGWIDYETGIISGYEGNWGEITGDNLVIPEGTTDIYLLDETGKKLISGESWEYNIPIGKSIVTLNFDGKSLKFGVKEGNYFIGETGKFFLRYVSKKNYLKLEEVNVEFILNKLTSKTTIEFLNPMMRTEELGTGIIDRTGMVSFGADKDGKAVVDGNHSYTHDDKRIWWRVQGAETYKTGEIDYEVYNKNGNLLYIIRKDKIYNYWGIRPDQVNYYIGFSENGNIDLGIYSKYSGNRVEDTIYLVGVNEEGRHIRYEEINIIIDEFEPNAYGKVVPVENGVVMDNKEQQVGTGIENLKNDIKENILIDLGTNFRFYSRFRGIIDCISSGTDFILSSVDDVIIKPEGDSTTVILGKLKLVKETTVSTEIIMKEVTDLSIEARPEYYSLKLELTPEEYKKLIAGTKYQVFRQDNNYHTLNIGIEGKNTPLMKELLMDKPLNFKTTGASIEIKIENDILDFGKININQNKGKPIIREGYTYVTVVGNEINDFSVTPNNEEEGNTEIYLKNSDGTLDESKKLQVSKLKAEQVYEKKEESKLTRIYNFNGIVTVPLDSNVGEYLGETVINVTIIN